MKKLLLLLTLLICFNTTANANNKLNDIGDYFDDVLLIINFNHPYYDNIEFLKEIYSPHFKNIVFYGEQVHPEVNVISHHVGWFVHRAIRDAMERWPDYRGYICCQDDCFMNFWNLPRLNKDKIWFHQYWTASLKSPTHWWPWWEFPCGYQASVSAYAKLPKLNKKRLKKNCGSRSFAFSWADFVYVPGKYRQPFIDVSQYFDNPDVFLEIGLPTIFLSLEKFDRMEHLNPYWGGSINSIDLSTYKPEYDWVHPLKLSKPENREFIRGLISSN